MNLTQTELDTLRSLLGKAQQCIASTNPTDAQTLLSAYNLLYIQRNRAKILGYDPLKEDIMWLKELKAANVL